MRIPHREFLLSPPDDGLELLGDTRRALAACILDVSLALVEPEEANDDVALQHRKPIDERAHGHAPVRTLGLFEGALTRPIFLFACVFEADKNRRIPVGGRDLADR